jgi:hypothetical protein
MPMSKAEFGWADLLRTDAPKGSSLKAALFTTYDAAEERFLAENLFPVLLNLKREPDGEGTERQYFLHELDRRLKQLHDRLIVVSSAAREESGEPGEYGGGAYEWIWRSIRHLRVGSRKKAVQHAKLWLLHWRKDDGDEYLELVVSSANLTGAAFRDQIQAAWRACIKLSPQGSQARLRVWGILPAFIGELASSAGDDTRLTPFTELLARAECPDKVTFVASAPGSYSREELRRIPWGAAGLRQIMPRGRGPVNVSILSPYIGSWSADNLRRGCAGFGGAPDKLQLVWIDNEHPWAHEHRWLMPKASLTALNTVGAELLRIRNEPDDAELTSRFHGDHRPTDPRWSHAKVYAFKRGTSCRLLVTSANFSKAAWGRQGGNADLTIENFELGVCVEQGAWPFEDLEGFEDSDDAATVLQLQRSGEPLIAWGRAVWDGKKVEIEFRCDANRDVRGQIRNSRGRATKIGNWTVSTDARCRSARVPWTDNKRPPTDVQFMCGSDTMSLAVFDERPPKEREDTMPPEVENTDQALKDLLLFEQYGGRVATEFEDGQLTDGDQTPDPVDSEERTEEFADRHSDSYAVPELVLARQHLGVVDNWADRVKRAAKCGTDKFERQVLRHDGEMLIEAFGRQVMRDGKKIPASAIGARLAQEELKIRLKHAPEN